MDEYYYSIVGITVNGKRFFLLWSPEDEPAFLTDDEGILVFGGLFDLTKFAEKNGIELENGVTAYNMDDVAVTAETGCEKIIEKWNIISDFALTVGAEFSGEDKRYNDIYDKLFFGCNLPAMKHPPYTPEWSARELDEINRILAEGAELFKRFLIKS